MKPFTVLLVRFRSHPPRRVPGRGLLAPLALLVATLAEPAAAATALADEPLFATPNVPGNLVLPLSVEYPTAVSVAHPGNTYSSSETYLGYFDTGKCYVYKFVDVETTSAVTHFAPAGAATSRTCTGTNDYKWSGNYLNWAAMQTIDPFRWALTGGYRVVDTASTTIIEKAWASGQGGTGNFPDRVLSNATDIQNATPFVANGNLTAYVQGHGNQVNFASTGSAGTGGFLATYFNTTDLDASGATPVLTRTESVDFDWGTGSPQASVVNTDNFSARWVAMQVAPTTGTYNFQTESDDGVRLWVNGTLVIDNWTDHGATTNTSANIALTAGAPMNVRLEYYERTGGAVIRLRWKAPGASAYTIYTASDWWYAPVRVKVCDPATAAGGVESNCVAYANGYFKPEGLMQQYSDRIRYSVLGYLNDGSIQRDGGVLRARQKFIAPMQPVPGSADVSNSAAEWDASTGVFNLNPDATDAADTATLIGSPISNSGVINYLNKFGEINRGNYKGYDPVGELYYAALRYLKNLGNVSAWSDMSSASSAATKATWADGFPVITDWKKTVSGKDTGDPILYSCQRNFILGIGDVNTHADKNVPGPTGSANEPTKPGPSDGLMGDTTFSSTFNAVTATDKVGALQGLGSSLGSVENYGGCCNNNSALMSGLAYDANTRDIRPDLANPEGTVGQTVQTFWLDVLEYQTYKKNNQFYLAAKYGGFRAPSTFDPYSSTAALQTNWWNTTTDTVGSGTTLQPRPDNYYTSARPDQMIDGLTKAFHSIASAIKAYTTSFSTALPQLSNAGNASFSAQYDASNWTGEIIASTLDFDTTTGAPTLSTNWTLSDKLATQLAGAGWDTGRKVVTWNGTKGVAFRATSGTTALTTAQYSALDPSYVSGNDSSNYLDYLRGNQTNEQGSTVSGSTKAYRARAKLIGDVVGSKARPVAAPSFPFTDATNPGYASFKSSKASRSTVLYVGANDGMLHAIDGRLTSGGGTELFAYVPSALFQGPNSTPNVDGLASLGNPTPTHHFMVNASPNDYDIDFARTPDSSGAARTGTADWRSVLIGGLGKGGKSYYAIDVSADLVASPPADEAAVASKVLWEFTNADMGYTFGDPIVVKTKKYGWVVILTSGYNNADGKGYFFIVNPSTGALLEKVSTGAGSAGNSAGLAHANAFVVDSTDGTADAVYAGDLLGNLWRWDVTATSGTYPTPLKIATLTDAGGTAQPVTTRPLIEVHPKTKKRYVMLGTGKLLDTTDIDSSAAQSYYMISDGSNARFNSAADLPTGTYAVTFPITRSKLLANSNAKVELSADPSKPMGWYEDLGVSAGGIGWRVVSESSTLLGTVAFAATLPNGSACNPSGDSRIYGRDFSSGKSNLKSQVSGVTTPEIWVPLDGNITDLRNLSVDGKGRLIAGTDTGKRKNIEIESPASLLVRRLNWRELQLVD